MKRILLYILIFLFIGESTGLSQLAKIPALCGHFQEHQALNPEIGFFSYLSMHYWGEDLNDDDDERDMQLPFKKHDVNTPAFLFVPANKIIVLKPTVWSVERDFCLDRTVFYFNPAQGSLFRPPRV